MFGERNPCAFVFPGLCHLLLEHNFNNARVLHLVQNVMCVGFYLHGAVTLVVDRRDLGDCGISSGGRQDEDRIMTLKSSEGNGDRERAGEGRPQRI